MLEYLSSVQSAVRRINYRLKTISDKLGKDSSMINNYTSQLDVLLPENYRIVNGVPQITNPSELYKNDELNNIVETLDNTVTTWGDIRQQNIKSYERYRETQDFFNETPVTIEEYINVMLDIPDALAYLYSNTDENTEKARDIMSVKGRKKSYNELQNVIDLVNKSKG